MSSELLSIHEKFIKESKCNVFLTLIPLFGFIYISIRGQTALVRLAREQATEAYVDSQSTYTNDPNLANINPKVKNLGMYMSIYSGQYAKCFQRFLIWGLIVSIYFAIIFPWILTLCVIKPAQKRTVNEIKKIEERIQQNKITNGFI